MEGLGDSARGVVPALSGAVFSIIRTDEVLLL